MNLKDKLKIYIENNYEKNNWMEELFSFKNICDDIEDIDTYIMIIKKITPLKKCFLSI